jgi:hypothetical protein
VDLLSIIRDGIDKLPEGEHPGLKAVINHIEVAIRHLQIGQSSGDDQLYTDAVYRCNQAFEGSVKELYRVVATKDPSKTTPQKIEDFFEKSNILRPKVINQLKRYRQEWRNPSTHDYMLDFDEDEAFLAIVNIAAFAQTAVSQIASKLAFDLASQSKIIPPTKAKVNRARNSPDHELGEAVGIYAGVYLDETDLAQDSDRRMPEGQVASMLAGFLSSIDDAEADIESQVAPDKPLYADIVMKRGKDRCVVELRSEKSMTYQSARGLEQLKTYMEAGNINSGVLVIYAARRQKYAMMTAKTDDQTIRVVLPKTMAEKAADRWSDFEFERYDIV